MPSKNRWRFRVEGPLMVRETSYTEVCTPALINGNLLHAKYCAMNIFFIPYALQQTWFSPPKKWSTLLCKASSKGIAVLWWHSSVDVPATSRISILPHWNWKTEATGTLRAQDLQFVRNITVSKGHFRPSCLSETGSSSRSALALTITKPDVQLLIREKVPETYCNYDYLTKIVPTNNVPPRTKTNNSDRTINSCRAEVHQI